MKNKISKNLLIRYVNGDMIEDVEKLESDPKFMKEVFLFTRDKKMYALCSDEVRGNATFVLFLFRLFPLDKAFLVEVANGYFALSKKEDVASLEIYILLSNLLKESDLGCSEEMDIMIARCHAVTESMLFQTKSAINIAISEVSDLSVCQELGLGFSLVNEQFFSHEVILDFFAKSYLHDIFKKNQEGTFEDILHQKFAHFEKLKGKEIQKFLLSYISSFDQELSWYVGDHIYLLDDFLKTAFQIITNWKNYSYHRFHALVECFEMEANDAIEKFASRYGFLDYCIHLDKMNLGLPYSLIELYFGFVYHDDTLDDLMEQELCVQDFRCLKEIVRLATEIFLKGNLVMPEDDYLIKHSDTKTKILSFE